MSVGALPLVAAGPGRAESAESAELAVLEQRITEAAGHLAAATGAWLGLVAEFDRRRGWAVHGLKSCAHWLSWRCGIGLVTGREHVRVARALAELPATRAALAAGRLSYAKVRALTRVATPANEADLVVTALHATGAQLDQLVAGIRKAGTLGQVNARHAARSLSWSWAEDGSLVLKGRFAPEEGALVLAALDAARDSLPPEDDMNAAAPDSDASAEAYGGSGASAEASPEESGSTGHGEPEVGYPKRVTAAANADALVRMAETLLATGPAPAPGGLRHQVNIHTDLDALAEILHEDTAADAATAGAGARPARIENGPDLHPETLRRLCCDSGAVIVAHHQNNQRTGRRRSTWMDVGRRTRIVPAALRRALQLRDRGCRFPGCTEQHFVDAHHVIYWSRGGPTALWNLVLLCRRHHRYVHEGGYRITTDRRGTYTFHRPDESLIPDAPRPTGGTPEALPALHNATITPDTTIPRWYGERLDLHYAVSVHLQPRHASAEAFIPAPPSDASMN
jgi:hypothetical protein